LDEFADVEFVGADVEFVGTEVVDVVVSGVVFAGGHFDPPIPKTHK
jgi:hypothetical protein